MQNSARLLNISDTISTSWQKVHGTKGSVWAALGILFVTMFIIGFIGDLITQALPSIEFGINLVTQAIGFLFQVGILYIGIRRAQDLSFSYRDMFRSFQADIIPKLIAVYLFEIVIFIPPMILAFVGGYLYGYEDTTWALIVSVILCCIAIAIILFLSVRLSLAMAFVLDRKAGPWNALKSSFRATRSNFWRLLGLSIAQFLILFVSALPLGIGLIWGLPLVFVIYGTMYKTLSVNV